MPELYLGRSCDEATLEPGAEAACLDTRKLVRHGVLLGMTGSGKTGMGVCLLEEVAMSGVPVIAIDPKGDLTNLALAFPELLAADFEPWIDPAEARRKNVDVATRAADVASSWRRGHEQWNVDAARRSSFADSTVTVYTPGSTAGVPVNVLASLRAPDAAIRQDAEGLTELAVGTVGALLGLAGVTADSFRDPEAIVLTQILYDSWTAGQDLSLETVLTYLIDPPFDKVGVFPVDTFFPRAKRMNLAMKLNAVVASPAFAPWSQGVTLDLDTLLRPGGRAPVHVFTIAHLDESMRTFFLATLLNAMVAWSRRQPGTGDLRAMLYIDEVFGMLPPHPANPPSKQPVLTLMKQARAVGVGVVLATQNPVDLDYKALSNAGTWLVGRLQTEQDRERVIDGLAAAGGALDRKSVDQWLQQMPGRTFVHRDAGEQEPRLMHSRWAISYLRGPLTRQEIERLPQAVTVAAAVDAKAETSTAPMQQAPAQPEGFSATPAPAPGGVRVAYLAPGAAHKVADLLSDLDLPRSTDGKRVWVPAAWISLDLRFDEGTRFSADSSLQRLILPLGADPESARAVSLERRDIVDDAPDGWYAQLPGEVDQQREAKALEKALIGHIHRSEKMTVFRHKSLKLISDPEDSAEKFRARVEAVIQERIDADIVKLKGRTEKLVDRLQDRIERKQLDLGQAQSTVRAQQTQEVVNVGETLLGLFLGGRKKSLSTSVSRRRQTMRAQSRVADLETQLRQLEEEVLEQHEALTEEMTRISDEHRALLDDIDELEVGLERNDISLRDFVLLWIPV